MKICPECGASWNDEYRECGKCGAALPDVPKEEISALRRNKGRILTYTILLAAFAVIVGAILWLFIDSRVKTAVLFRDADGYSYLSGDGDVTPFFKTDKELENVRQSDDGEYVYFLLDGILYRKKAESSRNAKAVMEGVRDYALSADGKQIAVLDKDGTLFRLERKPTELAKNVTEFSVSEDGSVVLYRTADGGIFYQRGNGDPETVAADADRILFVSTDGTTVYYQSGDAIFVKSGWDEPREFCKNANECTGFCRDGSCYLLGAGAELFLCDENERKRVTDGVCDVLWVGRDEPMLLVRTEDGKRVLVEKTECTVLPDTVPVGLILFCDGESALTENTSGLFCADIESGECRTLAKSAETVVKTYGATVFLSDGALYFVPDGKEEEAVAVAQGVTDVIRIADGTGYRCAAIPNP